MTLPLTTEMMAAGYDYLATTPPFSGWNLPDSEDVVFKLSRRPREFGRYQWDGSRHTITASVKSIAHTSTLMQFMSHEMIHLYLEKMGWESVGGNEDTHNAAFRKFAVQVCKRHGYDPKAFY
jgi:hypothetical protein